MGTAQRVSKHEQLIDDLKPNKAGLQIINLRKACNVQFLVNQVFSQLCSFWRTAFIFLRDFHCSELGLQNSMNFQRWKLSMGINWNLRE